MEHFEGQNQFMFLHNFEYITHKVLTNVVNGKPGWKLLRFGSKVHTIFSSRLSFTTAKLATVDPVEGSLTVARTSMSFS